MLQIHELGRDYISASRTLTVLNNISFDIEERDFVAITGPSGSGKSTLLALMAGLDRPTRGTISILGTDITTLNEDALSRFRGKNIGFVFQSFQLIPTLTALENVRVPAELQGDHAATDRAVALLERVGFGERRDHYPGELSGGEMQRVAIARAVLTRPSLLLADEPTGNLDSANGEAIMELLTELGRECTIVLVTHDRDLANQAKREIRLRDGHLEDIRAA
jgi:putative ABC transport system ATP-binding protein